MSWCVKTFDRCCIRYSKLPYWVKEKIKKEESLSLNVSIIERNWPLMYTLQIHINVFDSLNSILLELNEFHLVIGTDMNAILDMRDKSNNTNYNPHATKALQNILGLQPH
jgi:hypothetical protein